MRSARLWSGAPATPGLERRGPVIAVQIAAGSDSALWATAVPSHDALVDTGASVSCIDSDLARFLALKTVDRAPFRLSVVGGDIVEATYHLAYLSIPALAFRDHVAFACIDALATELGDAVILGRDLLSRFQLAYDGPRGQAFLRYDDLAH